MEDVSAFVLAGGKSTRMGRDKALLVLDGRTLVERAVALARLVSNHVWIVGDAKKYSRFGTVVEDLYVDRGPLGGIHAALAGSASQWNLMLAVDLPFLSPDFLKWMIEVGSKAEAVVTVPRTGGGLQPLSAVYHQRFASTAVAALEAGRNKIDASFREVKTRIIDEDEITRQGYPLEMFRNVNTPEEWERVVSNW
ncbi:MAG TPA: molybdenum cofactor guanylyltransferase [Terriglobales bacterium]|nr:molybdenum cofactor guanylyltransferase [Terriglobales bacterium]